MWHPCRFAATAYPPLAALLLGCAGTHTHAATATSLKDFTGKEPGDYTAYVFTLTYLGPQTKTIKTLIFGSAAHDGTGLASVQGADSPTNACPRVLNFGLRASEVQRIVQALPAVLTGSGDEHQPPILSLTIVRDFGRSSERTFKVLLGVGAAPLALKSIAAQLDESNREGATYMRYWTKNVGG